MATFGNVVRIVSAAAGADCSSPGWRGSRRYTHGFNERAGDESLSREANRRASPTRNADSEGAIATACLW